LAKFGTIFFQQDELGDIIGLEEIDSIEGLLRFDNIREID